MSRFLSSTLYFYPCPTPLSLFELKDRTIRLARAWQAAPAECADAQAFWIDFFHVFDVKRPRVASFAVPIRKTAGR